MTYIIYYGSMELVYVNLLYTLFFDSGIVLGMSLRREPLLLMSMPNFIRRWHTLKNI